MITATIFEAKTNLSELLKKAQAGETVIITSGRDKTPIAKPEGIIPPRRNVWVDGKTRTLFPTALSEKTFQKSEDGK